MGIYNLSRENSNIRSYEDITNDFLDYLIETKFIPIEDKSFYQTPEGRGEIIELLVDKLYEVDEIDGIMCSSLNAFYCWCRFVIKQDPNTKGFVWNKLMKQLFLDVEHHRFTCVMVSRGHGKSFFFGALYIPFKMWLLSRTQVAYIANVPQMTKRTIRLFKEIVNNNEMLKEKINPFGKGEKEFVWTQTELEYNGGFLETTTIGGQIRSAHVNFLVFDDILRDDNIYSYSDYENFVFNQAVPIVNRKKARLILVGTPLNSRDIFHTCMNEQEDGDGKLITDGRISARGFYSVAYPMVLNWDKKDVLLPDVFSWEDVQRTIKIQGERAFWKEYMLVCSDASNRIFNDDVIKQASTYDEHLDFNPEKNVQYVIGCDVATSGGASADFSAFIVLKILRTDQGNKKYVKWIVHKKGMPITGIKDVNGNIIETGQVDTIEELARNFNNALVVVEKNNVGVALIQELQKRNINVEGFVTTAQSKPGMIRYLVNEMTNDNLKIPMVGEECIKLRNELSNFGIIMTRTGAEKMEALAGHDDLCGLGDNDVFTNTGVKKLKDVTVHDMVLTQSGKFHKVLKTSIRRYTGPIYKIKIIGQREVGYTFNHPVYSINKNDFIDAEKIEMDDKLLIPKLNEYGPKEYDLAKYISSKHYNIDEKFITAYRNKSKTKFNRYIKNNNKFSFLVGLILAEGCITQKNIRISLSKTEINIFNMIKKYCKDLFNIDIKYIRDKRNNGIDIYLYHNLLTSLFRDVLKKENKKLPTHLYPSSKKGQLYLCAGYLIGDGCFHNDCYVASSISKNIIDIIQLFLSNNGLVSTVRNSTMSKKCFFYDKEYIRKPQFNICVNKVSTVKLYNSLNNDLKKLFKKPSKLLSLNPITTINKQGLSCKIEYIECEHYDGYVYNLLVDVDNTYYSGFLVHNCLSLAIANQAVQTKVRAPSKAYMPN